MPPSGKGRGRASDFFNLAKPGAEASGAAGSSGDAGERSPHDQSGGAIVSIEQAAAEERAKFASAETSPIRADAPLDDSTRIPAVLDPLGAKVVHRPSAPRAEPDPESADSVLADLLPQGKPEAPPAAALPQRVSLLRSGPIAKPPEPRPHGTGRLVADASVPPTAKPSAPAAAAPAPHSSAGAPGEDTGGRARKPILAIPRSDGPLPRVIVRSAAEAARHDASSAPAAASPPSTGAESTQGRGGAAGGAGAPGGGPKGGRGLLKTRERGGAMAAPPPASEIAAPEAPANAQAASSDLASQETQQKYEKWKARVEEAPNDEDAIVRLASICADLGRVDEAVEHFRVAARLDPKNGYVRQRLRELAGEEAAAVADTDVARGPFSSAVAEFLTYPFQGNGIAVLVLGAIFFGIVNALTGNGGGILSLLLKITLFGYMASFQLKVLQLSAQGKREPPDWPDLTDAFGDAMRMLGAHLAAGWPAGVLLLCTVLSLNAATTGMISGMRQGGNLEARLPSLPGHGGGAMTPAGRAFEQRMIDGGMPPAQARRAALEEFGEAEEAEGEGGGLAPSMLPFGGAGGHLPAAAPPPPPAPPGGFRFPWAAAFFLLLALMASVAGTAYFPLALLMTAIFNTSRPAFDYKFGLETAYRIWSDYLVCAGICIVFGVVFTIVTFATTYIFERVLYFPLVSGIIGAVIVSAVSIYEVLAISHLIGRLYYHNESRIGWLSR